MTDDPSVSQAAAPPPSLAQAPATAPKDKTVAGLLAILIGGFGTHKFYLGYATEGVVMLLVYFGLILSTIMLAVASVLIGGLCAYCVMPLTFGWGIIPIVEGVIYLTKTDQQFYETYVAGRRGWF